MNKEFNTAILLLVFNRPDTTEKVFEKIREIKPTRLYVAADGPRSNKKGESKDCELVRKIVTNIDWKCDLKTLFRDENLGCKIAVSEGINWFFENEKMGIILEDDCLPNDTFFRFCEILLQKYEGNEHIMTISGNNFQPKRRSEYSYYFSKYMHCWGWATWKNSWYKFDIEMQEWPDLKQTDFLKKLSSSKKEEKYWSNIFDRVYQDKIDSWAYIWNYSIWKENGLNILPIKNLVSNIGFGENSTHTKDPDSSEANKKNHELLFPIKHPTNIKVDKKADEWTFRNVYTKKINITKILKKTINKILK